MTPDRRSPLRRSAVVSVHPFACSARRARNRLQDALARGEAPEALGLPPWCAGLTSHRHGPLRHVVTAIPWIRDPRRR